MNGDGSDDARPVGLGIHQGVELLLGVFLVISSTRVPGDDGGVVLGFGVTLLVLPAITSAPLAAFRILSPAVHRVLDMVLVMVAIASPFLPLGVEGNADLILVLAGLALAVLARSTSYAPRYRRRRSPQATGPPPTPPTPPPPVAPPTSAWARGLGTAAGRARTELPRQAGRVVGRMKKGRP